MGEIRGGEGRSREATTANLVAMLRDEAETDGEVVERIVVRSATDDLYAVQIWRRSDPEPEGFFVRLSDHLPASPTEPDVKGPREADGA